jgi:hypothetical protein
VVEILARSASSPMRIATSSLDLLGYWKVYGAPKHLPAAPGAAMTGEVLRRAEAVETARRILGDLLGPQERQATDDNDATR